MTAGKLSARALYDPKGTQRFHSVLLPNVSLVMCAAAVLENVRMSDAFTTRSRRPTGWLRAFVADTMRRHAVAGACVAPSL